MVTTVRLKDVSYGIDLSLPPSGTLHTLPIYPERPKRKSRNNYRLTHSASELSGFTCTSSLTMNEKFQYRTRPPSAVLKNFESGVSSSLLVNECR